MLFGEGIETAGKPVIDDFNQEPVDLRSKKETEGGEGENTPTEEEAAAAKALEEKNTRKEAFLAEGKTEEEFDAAELAATEAAAKTPDQLAEEKKIADEKLSQEAAIEVIRKEERQKILAEMGVATEEELKAKLTPTQPKTADQLAQEQEIYNISLGKYAVENKVFNNDEWLGYQNIKKAADPELVYQNFAAEYKEANKGRTLDNQPDPVTEDEVKDKFNEFYHIDSDNKALKEQGEKNIALKAKAIRDPLETKFNDIKEIYDGEMAQKQAVPQYRNFIQDILKTAIPDKLEFGTGDDKVVFDLSTFDKDAFEKKTLFENGFLQNEFQEFLKGKGTPEQRARIEREIKKEIFYLNQEAIAKENFKAGISKGTKTTAPGAKAPFVEPEKREQQAKKVEVTAEDNQKVANAFA